MILSTTERKERTGDEVSDAADLDLFVPPCWEASLPNRNKHEAGCVVHTSFMHTHIHVYTGMDGSLHGPRLRGAPNKPLFKMTIICM